jgi:hypothetical protein
MEATFLTIKFLVMKGFIFSTTAFEKINPTVTEDFYNTKPSFIAGVDVIMITIFCDLCHFSEKKMAFFSKTNVMLIFLKKVVIVGAKKTPIFLPNFSAKIFLNS